MSLLVAFPLSWCYQLPDTVTVEFAEWPDLANRAFEIEAQVNPILFAQPIRKRPRRQLISATHPNRSTTRHYREQYAGLKC